MLHLYLDESGDLGFDFVSKKPSKFFTLTILVVSGTENHSALFNAVRKTRKRKLPPKGSLELKGSKTSLPVKKYFFSKVSDLDFDLYSLTLNKRRLYPYLVREKERIYNYVARLVLDKIPLEGTRTKVALTIDRSKGRHEILDFNVYIIRHLQGRLDPNVPLDISHCHSHESPGLQAVDMFCWGIFRKYERKDYSWLQIFQKKVRFETIYLPDK